MADPITAYLSQYWGEILAVVIGSAILSAVAWALNQYQRRRNQPVIVVMPKLTKEKDTLTGTLIVANRGKDVLLDLSGHIIAQSPKLERLGTIEPNFPPVEAGFAAEVKWVATDGTQSKTANLYPTSERFEDVLITGVAVFTRRDVKAFEFDLFDQPNPVISEQGKGAELLFVYRKGESLTKTTDFKANIGLLIRGRTEEGDPIKAERHFILSIPDMGKVMSCDLSKAEFVES